MSMVNGTGQIVVAGPIRKRQPGELSIMSRMLDRVRAFLRAGVGWTSPLLASYGWSDPRWWTEDPADIPAPVTETTALGLPPFGRGLDLIASTIAGVELVAYRYDKADQIDVKLDPQPELLRDPDPISTPWGWKYAAICDLVQFGNTFGFLGDPNAEGWPRWLNPVDATQVELGRNLETGTLVWNVGGMIVPFGELWHASAGNRSGYILGRGVIAQYRDALSGVLATDDHAARYFRRGGLPSAVIKVNDTDLQPEKAAKIKSTYMATIGRGRSREPMVIPGNYDFTPVVSDAEQQQLVEARRWDAQLVAMILGIPSHMLGLPGASMTYQNIEQADIAFVRDTVDRWAKPIEAAVTKWLLPAGQTSRFDWLGRFRTDAKTRAEVLKLEIDAGVATVDEGRRMLNRRPLPPEEKPQIPPQLAPFTGQTSPDSDDDTETEPTPEVAA